MEIEELHHSLCFVRAIEKSDVNEESKCQSVATTFDVDVFGAVFAGVCVSHSRRHSASSLVHPGLAGAAKRVETGRDAL